MMEKMYFSNPFFFFCCYYLMLQIYKGNTNLLLCVLTVPDMGRLLIHHLCFLLISMLACQCPAVSGLFEWLRRTEAPPPTAAAAAAVAPALVAKDAQFEMATADEKFLAEAKQMEISPLDSCHYRVQKRARVSQSLTQNPPCVT